MRLIAMLLAILAAPAALFAQDVRPLPPAREVPVHSTVNVSTLPPAPGPGGTPTGVTVKPFLTRDPEQLREGRNLMRQSPETVPPAPGLVEDRRPDR